MQNSIIYSKTIINKLMEMNKRGVSAEDITANIFYNYYEFLRQNDYSRVKLYSDVQAVKNVIFSWKNFNDTQLPRTYEKNLLLASIFSCEISDLVYVKENGNNRTFEFSLDFMFTKVDDVSGKIEIYLPRIRVAAGEKGDVYSQDINTLDKCYKIFSVKKLDEDGLTLLDRISEFITENGYEQSIEAIERHLRSVYFTWKNRRAPGSVESLLLFSAITGLDLHEMYRPVYEKHQFNIYWERYKESNINKLKTTDATKKFIESYFENENIEGLKYGNDYIVTKQGEKFGIILLKDGYIYYLDTKYKYIYKDKEKIWVIDGNEIFEVNENDMKLLTDSSTNITNVNCLPVINLCNSLTLLTVVSILGRYVIQKFTGGILIWDRLEDTIVECKCIDINEKEKHFVRYENGRRLYGILTETILIPPLYDRKIVSGENMYAVCKDGKYGYLDSLGRLTINNIYDEAGAFSEGYAAVCQNGKYGYLDYDNNLKIDFLFDEATEFHEGLAPVMQDDKAGYIDKTGAIVIPLIYDRAFRFSEGIAVIEIAGKYGYVDKNGEIVLPAIYDDASLCRNGNVKVLSCGKLINKKIRG